MTMWVLNASINHYVCIYIYTHMYAYVVHFQDNFVSVLVIHNNFVVLSLMCFEPVSFMTCACTSYSSFSTHLTTQDKIVRR